jgi:dual specificity tyrosine-phosphorylation-regulated kinase 2/3/4
MKPIENQGNHMNVSPRKPLDGSPRVGNPRFQRNSAVSQRASVSNVNPIVPNGPIAASEARKQYGSILTPYEQKEIEDFSDIYYLGQYNKKVKPLMTGGANFGYDDAQHHYRASIGDHIAYRFEIRSILGKGAFGQVLKCYDHKNKTSVALKVIVNTELMQEQGRIECSIVQYLNRADPDNSHHIIHGIDFFIFRKHICVTFDILGPNLYEYSRSMRFRPIPVRQLKPVAKQMLEALAFCHANKIVHCDMKPENVLLEPGGFQSVRVIDFGSSCFIGRQRYEYIQSRFYRAPEVILGIKYGPPMDIWSVACIMVELLIGRPLFPGDTEHEQLDMWMEVLGPPSQDLLAISGRKAEFFASNGQLHAMKGAKRRRVGSTTIENLTHLTDKLLVDLLKKCFVWEQDKRITAADALNHPWFTVKEITSARTSTQHLLPGLIR